MTLISIEGNIGVGKSTLLARLRTQFPDAIFVDEPVSEWNTIVDSSGTSILEKYYSDQKRYAFAFQMMAFITRARRLKNLPSDKLIFTERSVFTDREIFAKMLFDSDKIEDIEYQIYLKWFDDLSSDIKVDKVIYLREDPEECLRRVNHRARQGEEIPLEYLQMCHQYHENWLSGTEGVIINPTDDELSQLNIKN